MRILARAALLTAMACAISAPIPALSANAGEPCAEADIGKAQLDNKRENMIVCLLNDDGKTASWKTTVQRQRYSKTCDDWEAAGHKSKRECVQDGRWHLVYVNDENGNASYGDYAELQLYVSEGADVKIANASDITYCQKVGWRPGGVTCYGGLSLGGDVRFKKGDQLDTFTAVFSADAVRADATVLQTAVSEQKHYGNGMHMGVGASNINTSYAWFVKY